jgi:hypothetical protein
MSIAFWMNPASTQHPAACILSKSHNDGGHNANGFSVQQYSDLLNQFWFFFIPAYNDYYATTTIEIDQAWSHVAIIKQDNQVFLYSNGMLGNVNTLGGSTILANGDLPLTIGTVNWGQTIPATPKPDNSYQGSLDELYFYNRPLSSAEVLALYLQESPTSAPSRLVSSNPSSEPSLQPTSEPSSQPTCRPSVIPSSRPSSCPSGMPSSLPSSIPSLEPTVYPTLHTHFLDFPGFGSINVSPSSTECVLTVELNSASHYGGSLYCNRFISTFAVSSSDIVKGGIYIPFSANENSLQLTFRNLLPSTSYVSYCAIQLSDGRESSASEIESSKMVWETVCCRSIVFTSVPSIFYTNSTRYEQLKSNVDFSVHFALSHAPVGLLLVTPVVQYQNGTLLSIFDAQANPNTFSFDPSSGILSASFRLKFLNSKLKGYYNMSLLINGPAASDYNPAIFTRIFVSNTPPPPSMLKAIVGDSGSDLFIRFDSPTDSANIPYGKVFACSNLLTFQRANDSQCYWLNSTTIRSFLPLVRSLQEPIVQINDSIVLLSEKIKAFCRFGIKDCLSYNYSTSQSLQLQYPYNPTIPSVRLITQRTVGSCETSLRIDSTSITGTGGRPFLSFKWNIFSLVPRTQVSLNNISSVENLLNSLPTPIGKFKFSRSSFSVGTYSISLNVQNWLLKSTSDVALVDVLVDNSFQSIELVGNFPLSIIPKQQLEIRSRVIKSACNSNITIAIYKWSLLDGDNRLVSTTSDVSQTSSVFRLNPYALLPDNTYTVVLSVYTLDSIGIARNETVQARVIVGSGHVKAVVRGGKYRSIPAFRHVLIDGSDSYDENVAIAHSNLNFSWSCMVVSFEGYGKFCNDILDTTVSPITNQPNAAVRVMGELMQSNLTYQITLLVSSVTDGRSDYTTVTVQQTSEYSGYTSILSRTTIANVNQNLSLDGRAIANYSAHISWQAYIDGENFTFPSHTPLQILLSRKYMTNSFMYSLLVAANTFPIGALVTLRITAVITGSLENNTFSSQRRLDTAPTVQYVSSSQIEILINGDPYHGVLEVSPTSGKALSTDFNIYTYGWEDNPSDYPLYYSFFYQQNPLNPTLLTIALKTQATSITSNLPAGLQSYQYQLLLEVTCSDVYNALSNATTMVTVIFDPNVDVNAYLQKNLQLAYTWGDSDLLFSTVNNVASTISVVNCSRLTVEYCSSLNRFPCSSKPQTCGSCLDGYRGIVGPANALCHRNNTNAGLEGSKCLTNNDCLYGSCRNQTCSLPFKLCSSASANSTCSGHGFCQYSDSSGVILSSPCFITDVYCSPKCICSEGYGGEDCSLDYPSLLSRDNTRGILCEAISNSTQLSEPSTNLLSSIINSLSVSYSPTEVISESSNAKCRGSLEIIAGSSQAGFLVGSSYNDRNVLIETISKYVVPSEEGSTSYLDSIMTDVTSGILQTMRNGQVPEALTSSNIRISVQKPFAEDLQDAFLIPPPTPEAQQYGVELPSFQLVGDSGTGCITSEGYSYLSVMQWGDSPFPNASTVHSPMLRFSGQFPDSQVEEKFGINQPNSTSSYYVTLPFLSKQDFDFNISLNDPASLALKPNVTFPNCTVFENGGYVSCGNCELSTYTNFNVTFSCVNVENLCQRVPVGNRRNLGADDDYFSDDSVSGGSGMSAEQYGALLEGVGQSFISVLSSNPFDINLEEAKVVLSFVGCLILVFLLGTMSFMTWDAYDKSQLIYGNAWPPKPLFAEEFMSKPFGGIFGWFIGKKVATQNESEKIKTQSKSSSSSSRPTLIRTKTVTGKREVFSEEMMSFFNLVVPDIFKETQKSWALVWKMIIIRHDYTNIFFHPSSEKSRFLRWMDLYNSILNGLFISTLFFGTFYANTGECESYTTEIDCLAPMNKITADTQCLWSPEDESCSLHEPPANISFTVILALTCTLIGAPLQIGISFIIDEYCSKRPRLEDIGLSTEYWLGGGIRTIPLEISHSFDQIAKSSFLQRKLEGLSYGSSTNKPARMTTESSMIDNPVYAMQRSYENLLTTQEEYLKLVNAANNYYKTQKSILYKTLIANLNSVHLQAWQEINEAKEFEIKRWLGLQPNHEFLPLPIYEQLLFHRSRQDKVLKNIQRTRDNAQELIDQLVELSELNQASLEEVLLLYTFVLEQFPIFKRWVLKDQLLCFEGFFPSVIDFYSWFFAWLFVLGVYLFYCYWIFAWGVSNGNLLLSAWGLNFAIGTIQDIFFVQIAKIALVYFIAFFSIKPKLVEIRHILINAAMMLIQHDHNGKQDEEWKKVLKEQELRDYGISYDEDSFSEDSNDEHSEFQDLKVSHANSGVSFRKSIAASMASIFGGQQFSMIHSFSSACRVSWQKQFDHLFISRVFHQLDDNDSVRLSKQNVSFKSSTMLTYFIIFVPLAITFFGLTMAQLLFDTIFPLFSTGIILAGYYLSAVSVDYVIIVCFLLVGFLFWNLKVVKLALKLNLKQKEQEFQKKQGTSSRSPKILLIRHQSSKDFSNKSQSSNQQTAALAKPQEQQMSSSPLRIPRSITHYLLNTLITEFLWKRGLVKLIARVNFWRTYRQVKNHHRKKIDLTWKMMNLPLQVQGKVLYSPSSPTSFHLQSKKLSKKHRDFVNSDDDDDDDDIVVEAGDFDHDQSIHSLPPPITPLNKRLSHDLRVGPFPPRRQGTRNSFFSPSKSFLWHGKSAYLSYEARLVSILNDDGNKIELLYETLGKNNDQLLPQSSVEFDDFDNPKLKSLQANHHSLIRLDSLPPAILRLQNLGIIEEERRNISWSKHLPLFLQELIEQKKINATDSTHINEDISSSSSFIQNYLNQQLLQIPEVQDAQEYANAVLFIKKPKRSMKILKRLRMERFYEKYHFYPPSRQFVQRQEESFQFSEIDEFFHYFLMMLFLEDYESKGIRVTPQELFDLIALIILDKYRWLVTKQQLITVFTRFPKYLLQKQEGQSSTRKETIWDSFYPVPSTVLDNSLSSRLNQEQLEEIFSSFSNWIDTFFDTQKNDFTTTTSNSSSLKNNTYFLLIPFHLFKEWFTKELYLILKTKNTLHY